MAAKVIAGTAQLCLTALNTKCPQQLRTSITGELVQLTTGS